jgi:hypothetical protein
MAGICQWLVERKATADSFAALRNDNQKDRQQQREKQTRIPFGNDNKKTNARQEDKCNGKKTNATARRQMQRRTSKRTGN